MDYFINVLVFSIIPIVLAVNIKEKRPDLKYSGTGDKAFSLGWIGVFVCVSPYLISISANILNSSILWNFLGLLKKVGFGYPGEMILPLMFFTFVVSSLVCYIILKV